MDHMVGLPYLWKIELHLNAARSCACMQKDKCRPPCTQHKAGTLSISMASNAELSVLTSTSQISAPKSEKDPFVCWTICLSGSVWKEP